MVGRTLSSYQVLEPLGSGAMGRVYRARHERLHRDVALKVLPDGLLSDPAARARFRKEALALSQLNHPNIATVYDFDHVDGIDFLVMELVEGETLDQRLASGPLPEEEVIRLGIQLAEGVAAAHARGIVHRDLKPSNIALTRDGRVKILDFGLARALHADASWTESLTQAHTILGTLAYIAPEVLAGGRADERSDVYSCGAVLYQLATGRPPFTGDAAAVAYATMHETPSPPSRLRPRLSPALDQIILRTLEKTPDRRTRSAAQLVADLQALAAGRWVASAPRLTAGRWIAIAVALVVVAGAVAFALDAGGLRGRLFGAGGLGIRSLAVLPLENLSGDPSQEYFAEGTTEELITQLAQIQALKVISRTSVMRYKGTQKPLREIARELGVDAVVEGSVLRSGQKVRVTAQLIQASTDRHLWAASYDRDLRDVLALQSDVAREIARQIQITVTPGEAERLARSRPVDPAAHEEYLQGRFYWNQRTEQSLEKGVDHFQRAIALDPGYGSAYVGLADSYIVLGNLLWMPAADAYTRARGAALKAIEIDSTLAAAHASLGYVAALRDHDYRASEREFTRSIALSPSESVTYLWYGLVLFCEGRLDDARVQFGKSIENDPLSLVTLCVSTWPDIVAGNTREAIAQNRRVVDMDPQFFLVDRFLGEAYERAGEVDSAIATYRRGVQLSHGNGWLQGSLGYALGATGQRAEAQQILDRLRAESTTRFVSHYTLAELELGLGHQDRAMDELEKAEEERVFFVNTLPVDRRFDPLRGAPRFRALLAKVRQPVPPS